MCTVHGVQSHTIETAMRKTSSIDGCLVLCVCTIARKTSLPPSTALEVLPSYFQSSRRGGSKVFLATNRWMMRKRPKREMATREWPTIHILCRVSTKVQTRGSSRSFFAWQTKATLLPLEDVQVRARHVHAWKRRPPVRIGTLQRCSHGCSRQKTQNGHWCVRQEAGWCDGYRHRIIMMAFLSFLSFFFVFPAFLLYFFLPHRHVRSIAGSNRGSRVDPSQCDTAKQKKAKDEHVVTVGINWKPSSPEISIYENEGKRRLLLPNNRRRKARTLLLGR